MRRKTMLQLLPVVLALAALVMVAIHTWPVLTEPAINGPDRRGLLAQSEVDNLALEPVESSGEYQQAPTTMPSVEQWLGEATHGIRLVDADPPGVPIPEGARRLTGVIRVFPGERQQLGRYLVNEQGGVLETYYQKEMTAAGWGLVQTGSADALLFVRGRQRCRIQLSDTPDGVRMTIVLAQLDR